MPRPVNPLITRERAAQAALKIIDEEGLEKLNLKLVAKSLGVKAPSLYYHFQDKSELLAEVARLLVLNSIPKKKTSGITNWKDGIVDNCKKTRKALLQHPKATPLLLTLKPTDSLLNTYEYWFKVYDAPQEDHQLIIEGLEKMTFGSVLIGSSIRPQSTSKAEEQKEAQVFEECLYRFLATF